MTIRRFLPDEQDERVIAYVLVFDTVATLIAVALVLTNL